MSETKDNCGVFGIYSQFPCVYDVYNGIDFLQHRGQEYCGIATFDRHIHQVTHHGKVGNSFTEQDLLYLKGNWGIGHVSLWERQPMAWQSRLGNISVAFSGNVINAEEIIAAMKDQGHSFYRSYNIEVIAKTIMEADDMTTGIAALADRIRGAYSLVVLAAEGIYATRDIYGFRPLILGRNGTRFAVSSESRALQNLDMEVVRDVHPGEIILIDAEGFHTLRRLPSPRKAHCAFEWAYTASIDSVIDGLYVQEARNRLGQSLAQRDIDEQDVTADIVAPVPMSGIGHALGYHQRSRLRYQDVFLYNRYADRSYTQSSQHAREKMAKRKLSILRSAVDGKRIVICDDSIVRGTQIRDKVRDLKNAGAKEVHVRIACPPLMYPCDFGVSTRTLEELAARQCFPSGTIGCFDDLRTLERWIAAQIDADSVKYNGIDAFVEALGMPREDLCLKCWDGVSPLVR
ncbi:MAG TPA: amidophosphoribosyltransferase [Syntrophales bacterium]|jgi:amidophosphoribosyltransferase|nr:amidophosphoribosyltransferase [Syntrophales bacterium]HON23192.1 amidophosphoribosyltransferase [Syntrophales bacterium]HOU77938.1 amidophosphoribosyltransferase [Syntrophales bacterium]HPC33219.1 amidophosphoribosyltransferase [Syntrophales bacterium]HQG35292.1 amidophosphoribosyltransferase [Syntrophales bacterium]